MSPDAPASVGQAAALVAELARRLGARGQRLATAESCTGGLIAAACTDRAGSSEWFERGFVCYSNESKAELLGVNPTLIASQGAVSCEVAQAMARGALARSHAHWAVAVTGVAGPGGGTPAKPVGTVWLAWLGPGMVEAEAAYRHFSGDRAAVRWQTVQEALQGLLERLG